MKNSGSFFSGELFPEDVIWFETQTIERYFLPRGRTRHDYESSVAIIAAILRVRRKSAGRGSRVLSRRRKGSVGYGPQPEQIDFVASGPAYRLKASTKQTVSTRHCSYCGGPIDPSGIILPSGLRPLLGVKLGSRWYHRALCIAKRFGTL